MLYVYILGPRASTKSGKKLVCKASNSCNLWEVQVPPEYVSWRPCNRDIKYVTPQSQDTNWPLCVGFSQSPHYTTTDPCTRRNGDSLCDRKEQNSRIAEIGCGNPKLKVWAIPCVSSISLVSTIAGKLPCCSITVLHDCSELMLSLFVRFYPHSINTSHWPAS